MIEHDTQNMCKTSYNPIGSMLAFIPKETANTCAQIYLYQFHSVLLCTGLCTLRLSPSSPIAYASTPQTFEHAFEQHPACGAVSSQLRAMNLAPL